MSKRSIPAREILTHIYSEMTNDDLMETYKLTQKGLHSVIRKLVEANLLDRSKAFARVSLAPIQESRAIRKLDRKEIFVPLKIHEKRNRNNRGTIINITARGVGTKGIRVAYDDRIQMVVMADEFFRLEKFQLDARCRWVKEGDSPSEIAAGFEIISISKSDLEHLQNLIHTFDYMFR
jgi:hypothetical protein